jgi:hypothetical protein
MNITLRIPSMLRDEMLADLRRPHAFAFERIGFVYCKQSRVPSGWLLLAYRYASTRDDRYIEDDTVGARFDSSAIREAMQVALDEVAAALHAHLHDHTGRPRMSKTDLLEMQALMPCFVNLCPERMHGALILSADAAVARVWGIGLPGEGVLASKITSVGTPLRFLGGL